IINEYNHQQKSDMILFEEQKKFTPEIIEDIKFLTTHSIQQFQPTTKLLLSDASSISNWLDIQKEANS
ncbi:7295_t:CDS:2, partial [Scutellospora calospora]